MPSFSSPVCAVDREMERKINAASARDVRKKCILFLTVSADIEKQRSVRSSRKALVAIFVKTWHDDGTPIYAFKVKISTGGRIYPY